MKLLRIGPAGAERPAVLADDGTVRDAASVALEDYGPAFLATGGLQRLADALAAGDLPVIDVVGHRIGAPITRPGKLACIGLNYADHAAESGMELPAEPVVFFKATNTVVGPDDDVLLPIGGEKTDWEVELGVVIGAEARYLEDEAAAADVIAGYCVSNDVSERAFQLERGGQWVKGKSCETFNPLGPWLVTPDEIDDLGSLSLWLEVDGERVQDGSTADMVFGVHHLVWYLSQFMVLEPGDLINTGTPAGVGLGFDPPRYLREGDVMELSIEGLGTQRQVCKRATR
jgi:2-keto-4-pentenoate hydratase/2-oxohepta-3-ene-1,7-dioic acid hydratase in catechol pathway